MNNPRAQKAHNSPKGLTRFCSGTASSGRINALKLKPYVRLSLAGSMNPHWREVGTYDQPFELLVHTDGPAIPRFLAPRSSNSTSLRVLSPARQNPSAYRVVGASRATGLRWQSVLLNRLENSHFSRLNSSKGQVRAGVCNGAGRLGNPLSASLLSPDRR
jgi:hypothetical protein